MNEEPLNFALHIDDETKNLMLEVAVTYAEKCTKFEEMDNIKVSLTSDIATALQHEQARGYWQQAHYLFETKLDMLEVRIEQLNADVFESANSKWQQRVAKVEMASRLNPLIAEIAEEKGLAIPKESDYFEVIDWQARG